MARENKRYLSSQEIDEIVIQIVIPYDSIPEVIDMIQFSIRNNLRNDLEDIQIYPSQIPKLKKNILNSFLSSLITPKFPIGPITGDAVGQQATQTNLNTFHQAGSLKSGGSDGIREWISISPKRKVEYSTIHFKNESLTYRDVMEYKKDFIGISIQFLSKNINFKSLNFIEQQKNKDWWYDNNQFQNTLTFLKSSGETRSCLRIEFDIQKLYEYKVTTQDIALLIDNWNFSISKKKDEKTKITIKTIYSPTIFGIVDIYLYTQNSINDDYFISVFQYDELSNMYIKGIPGITNFYAIKTPVLSLIRDGENKNGKLHLYVNDNRFKGIPFFRFEKLLSFSGYQMDLLPEEYTDTLFDYNPANPQERRKKIIVQASNYRNPTYQGQIYPEHTYYTVVSLGSSKKGKKRWEISLNLPYINSGYVFYSVDNLMKFEFSDDFKIISFEKIPDIEEIIINTTDSYDSFMKKMRRPLSHDVQKILSPHLNDQFRHFLHYYLELSGYSGDFSKNTPQVLEKKLIEIEENYFLNYISAETTGAFLGKTLMHPGVNRRKTWCNNYYQIFNTFGIEALRNFLVFDGKYMINDSGYINGKYIELVSDVMTHTGMNPMTSEGILSHGRGSLAYATYDKVIQHLSRGMLVGKKENTDSTSISIILGQQIKFGTGGSHIQNDTPSQNHKDYHQKDYQVVKTATQVYRNDNFIPDVHKALGNGIIGNDGDADDPSLNIPPIIFGKLPMLSWIEDHVIIHDVASYIAQGIEILQRDPIRKKWNPFLY